MNTFPHNKKKVTTNSYVVHTYFVLSTEYLICINSFNLQDNPARKVGYYPHFAEE